MPVHFRFLPEKEAVQLLDTPGHAELFRGSKDPCSGMPLGKLWNKLSEEEESSNSYGERRCLH